MSNLPSNSIDVHIVIAVIIAACLCVAYWRTAIRLIILLLIVAAAFGVATMASFITAHP